MIRSFLGNNRVPYDVCIEAVDGSLHYYTQWTGSKKANSIVVRDSLSIFRIALFQSSVTMLMSAKDTDPLGNYMSGISDGLQAKLDIRSAKNTENILKMQSSTSYAAGYCNNYKFPDGKTNGLLPALGWLQIAYENSYFIGMSLKACGGTPFSSLENYWSSTFYGAIDNEYYCCWARNWDRDYNDILFLNHEAMVRPFANYEQYF